MTGRPPPFHGNLRQARDEESGNFLTDPLTQEGHISLRRAVEFAGVAVALEDGGGDGGGGDAIADPGQGLDAASVGLLGLRWMISTLLILCCRCT